MSKTAFRGGPANTIGDLPKVGSTVHFSNLVKNDLTLVSTENYKGKNKIISKGRNIGANVESLQHWVDGNV